MFSYLGALFGHGAFYGRCAPRCFFASFLFVAFQTDCLPAFLSAGPPMRLKSVVPMAQLSVFPLRVVDGRHLFPFIESFPWFSCGDDSDFLEVCAPFFPVSISSDGIGTRQSAPMYFPRRKDFGRSCSYLSSIYTTRLTSQTTLSRFFLPSREQILLFYFLRPGDPVVCRDPPGKNSPVDLLCRCICDAFTLLLTISNQTVMD